MKRTTWAVLILAVLAVAHVIYWYLPRERAVAPHLAGAQPGEPLAALAAGGYDVCVWVPYPHQNLGVLASVVDLPDVLAAVRRLARDPDAGGALRGADPGGAPRGADDTAGEPTEPATFGPFEVPPASEATACGDLGGKRVRVVARIYPGLTLVAKLAGHLAGNPWLAGGNAGKAHIAWDGRLWTVTIGPPAEPPALPAAGSPAAGSPAESAPMAMSAAPGASPLGPPAASPAAPPADLPASLGVVRWRGTWEQVPAGYYLFTHQGSDFALTLAATLDGAAAAPAAAVQDGPPATVVIAAGPGRHAAIPVAASLPAAAVALPRQLILPRAAEPPAAAPSGGAAYLPDEVSGGRKRAHAADPPEVAAPADAMASRELAAAPAEVMSPPAAMAIFEAGSSRLSSLGDLPGLAVFNVPGMERWKLPAASVFRFFAGHLPTSDTAGWRIVALDAGSLHQAEAIAPRLAALLPPDGTAPPGATRGALSFGAWVDPRASLRLVSRIRKFVEDFPLATRRDVTFWRDWETVLNPLADCDRATLTATANPPALGLRLHACTAEPR